MPEYRVVGSLARTYSAAAMPEIEHEACAEELRRISAEIAVEYMKIAKLAINDEDEPGAKAPDDLQP